MTLLEVKNYISSLTGHVTFEYNNYSCGIDPLALESIDMWYGSNDINVNSIDEVLSTKFFDGKSLMDIWEDVTEIDL